MVSRASLYVRPLPVRWSVLTSSDISSLLGKIYLHIILIDTLIYPSTIFTDYFSLQTQHWPLGCDINIPSLLPAAWAI